MKKNRLHYLVGAMILLLLVFLGMSFLRNGGLQVVDEGKLVIKDKSGELSVYRSGLVEYKTRDGFFTDNWSMEKTAAFFAYYEARYKEGNELTGDESGNAGEIITVGGATYAGNGDELTRIVIDEMTGGGGNNDGSGGGGEDISDYFGTPTPRPTPVGSGGAYSTSTPTPTASGGGGIPDGCIFWRLSYCVKYKPTPTPTPTPVSGSQYVIYAANCDEWNETQTGSTVINNTVCIPLD